MSYSENPWRSFEVALMTIELESAFLVAAQDGDNLFDAVFVTDANGLPCIPGESLAGILRHSLAGDADPAEDKRCQAVFGFQDRDNGQASRVRISYAHAHGKGDKPVPFRGARTSDDPVLKALQSGVGRDHVRIGKHGAVDQRGKFDELLVPAGARFSFEIALAKESGIKIADLLAQLVRTDVRVGGKTKRGLGAFKVVRAVGTSFDLTMKDDVTRFGRLPVAIEKLASSPELKKLELPTPGKSDRVRTGTITLRPIGTWMVGGGVPVGSEGGEPERHNDNAWDRVPLRERRIVWSDAKGGGKVGSVCSDSKAEFLVPASSLKGALRHRTAFHARRLSGDCWLEPGGIVPKGSAPGESLLFGEVREGDTGLPGCIILSDLYVDPMKAKLTPLQHVSLDRFTQGPMDHLLYDELALGETELKFEITIIERHEDCTTALKALHFALEDLTQGRLSLGAGRGHGRFLGSVKWENNHGLIAKEVANV